MRAQAVVNEELDSALVIARLRAQVDELRAELRCDLLESIDSKTPAPSTPAYSHIISTALNACLEIG